MIRAYWHKLPKEDQLAVKQFSGMTVGQFTKKYRQPRWCGYPEALQGQMGCWSLWYLMIHSEEQCKQCTCNKKHKHFERDCW